MIDVCQIPKNSSVSTGVCGFKYTPTTRTVNLHKHLCKKHASEPLTQPFFYFCNKTEKIKPVIFIQCQYLNMFYNFFYNSRQHLQKRP